jgi:hypothetical protein
MFYCETCRAERQWPESIGRSYGRCEICGVNANCNDRPSSSLPAPKALVAAPVKIITLKIEEHIDATIQGVNERLGYLPVGKYIVLGESSRFLPDYERMLELGEVLRIHVSRGTPKQEYHHRWERVYKMAVMMYRYRAKTCTRNEYFNWQNRIGKIERLKPTNREARAYFKTVNL